MLHYTGPLKQTKPHKSASRVIFVYKWHKEKFRG